jgi:D-alanine transaminase
MKIAFVNGEYCNLAEAKISIFDRGFLFGDAVYEVLPVYNGQPFFLNKHIDRLNSNLEKIKIEIPSINWLNLIQKLIFENGGGDLQVYIHVTRGNQGLRKHDIPVSIKPSIIAFTIHNAFPTQIEKEKGLTAKIIEDIRWLRCDIKTTSLLANILLNNEAVSEGYQTSILVRDGIVAEGSTSNVFIVTKEGVIQTPPLTHNCLPGVTRDITLELIKHLNWPFIEKETHTKDLFNAQEVWITSTTKEIYPVTEIDNLPINNGHAGEFWRTINESYRVLVS